MNTKCSKCGIQSVRVRVIDKRKDGRALHTDERGRLWGGLECPDCKYGNNKILRLKRVKRNCNVCDKPLPPNRYFNHTECLERRMERYRDIHSEYELHL